MTTTVEPTYFLVRPEHRGELVDKTPEAWIMVSMADYRAAVAQQQQCAGLTAAEWRKLWITTCDQAQEARTECDRLQLENQMLRVAVEAMKRQMAQVHNSHPGYLAGRLGHAEWCDHVISDLQAKCNCGASDAASPATQEGQP
jgi:hypothetical protein